jgi:hypothetical protein
MAKKGDKYSCGVCGIELECVGGCGCFETDLICCGKPMKRKVKKAAAGKKSKKK